MSGLARRDVLTGAAALLLAGAAETERAFAKEISKLTPPAYAGALVPLGADAFRARPVGPKSLWLKRPDGQEIFARYRSDTGYDQAQVGVLSWFMRDVSDNNHAVWIEPRLFDLLAGVQAGMSAVHGAPIPLILTSGYRTPAHNARLETAARNSMHLYGYAADLEAPGYDPRAIALAASFYGQGGIGLYDRFTHLDVWKVRTWIGRRSSVPGPDHPDLDRHCRGSRPDRDIGRERPWNVGR